MNITPIEIRQRTFEKGLRGYKPEDVDAFLGSLSQEWERVTSDYKMLKMQLELAEKELGKLREVEMTLFRTLKTAEDTSAQITEQANKAGEKYIGEAKQKADELLADARKRSALMVQDAENHARYLKDNILNDLKSLEHDFKALEGYKENLTIQIRTLASNAVDSVDRFEKKFGKQNLKGKIDEAATQIKEEIKQTNERNKSTIETPTTNSSDVVTPAVSNVDLPSLIDRETFVPEAIPTDESILGKLNEVIKQPTQPQSAQNLVTSTETSVKQNPSSSVAKDGKDTPLEPAPAEASSATKGGSFFDQI